MSNEKLEELNTSGSKTSEIACYPVGNIPVFHGFGWGGSHKGVDWIVVPGTNVHNMQHGEVVELANNSKTYGRYVMVLHDNGFASLYAHLSKLFVKKHEIIEGCYVLGLSGGAVGSDGAGASQGYHLHFEVRPPININYNWYNIDPIKYIESFVTCGS